MEEHESIELRSDEVQEILGTPPNWLIRWGTTVIFLVIVMLLTVSWLVKYADVVPAAARITTPKPPMNVVAEVNGRILELNVEDKQDINEGDLVAVLESSADYKDVMELEKKLLRYQGSEGEFPVYNKYKLGEIQYSYSNFIKSYKDYDLKATRGNFSKKEIDQLRRLIQNNQEKIRAEKDRQNSLYRNYSSAEGDVGRAENLYRNGDLSIQQLEEKRRQLNMIGQQIQDSKSRIISFNGEIESIQSQIIQVEKGNTLDGNEKWLRVQESLNILLGEIDKWKNKHLMTSPLTGKVSLFVFREANQYVKSGDAVMMVVPQQDKILGRVEIPANGAGRIEVGQSVNISLQEYPAKEFGVIRGTLSSLSLIAKDDIYMGEVELDNGLITSYKKQLEFRQDMSGIAEIKTKERRFIERIFDKFADLIKNT